MRRSLRQHIWRDAVGEVLRHQPGCEDPTAGLHPLCELDLARTKLDPKQRLYGASRTPSRTLGHRVAFVMLWWPAPGGLGLWHCAARASRCIAIWRDI